MSQRTYTVKEGDSLSLIAKEVYGDMGRWKEIYEANKDKISDPNLIDAGLELVIPEYGTSEAAEAGEGRAERPKGRMEADERGSSTEQPTEQDRSARSRGREGE
jgi:LysM repeat protein